MYKKIAAKKEVSYGKQIYYCNIYAKTNGTRHDIKVKLYKSKNVLADSMYDYYIYGSATVEPMEIIQKMQRTPKLWSLLDGGQLSGTQRLKM